MNKRRLGQNFLISTKIARRIAQFANVHAGDTVVEIGPGKGALTRYLLKTGARIIAVEIDASLAQLLKEKFAEQQNLAIINEDILTQSMHDLIKQDDTARESTKILGNIPFSITSPLIDWLVNQKQHFQHAILMLQKEFATRLTAIPHSKSYARLSVIADLHFKRKFGFDVGKNNFRPVPKVDASVIKLTARDHFMIPVEESKVKLFEDFLLHCFAHRRKTLLKSLQISYGGKKSIEMKHQLSEIFSSLHIKTSLRAEQLKLDEFWTLFKSVADRNLYE